MARELTAFAKALIVGAITFPIAFLLTDSDFIKGVLPVIGVGVGLIVFTIAGVGLWGYINNRIILKKRAIYEKTELLMELRTAHRKLAMINDTKTNERIYDDIQDIERKLLKYSHVKVTLPEPTLLN
jgi:hypothetical protein